MDAEGNLNVSKFGPKLPGAGGFINISQNAKSVVFVGTFKAGGLRFAVEESKLSILNEGTATKFVRRVEHVTFSGPFAASRAQPVLYVTERCVFDLTAEGLGLREVAPGIDIEPTFSPKWSSSQSFPRSRRSWTRASFAPNRWDCERTC